MKHSDASTADDEGASMPDDEPVDDMISMPPAAVEHAAAEAARRAVHRPGVRELVALAAEVTDRSWSYKFGAEWAGQNGHTD